MNIILIGPPGCGKGTQAEKLCHAYRLTYISTGNLIREHIASKSAIGIRAKSIIDAGKLLDDQTILEMVHHELQKPHRGVLFDGFPRTLAQAQNLNTFCPIDVVIDIQVSDDVVVKRISSRHMVEINGEQHTFASRADAQTYVDAHGGKVFQRDDDKESTVRSRLSTYHKQTEPLIAYYGKLHKLYIINGEKTVAKVHEDIVRVLSRLRK